MFKSYDFQPWRELSRLQDEARSVLEAATTHHRTMARGSDEVPLNVAVGDSGAFITALIPGVDRAALDVSILGETLTLKGRRQAHELQEGETYHRREQATGTFVRSVQLPFSVDAKNVEAKYRRGVLELHLPRSPADRPRRIDVMHPAN